MRHSIPLRAGHCIPRIARATKALLMPGIYCGAAGTMWALTTLARAYDVELTHDYADAIVKCEERYRRVHVPDWLKDGKLMYERSLPVRHRCLVKRRMKALLGGSQVADCPQSGLPSDQRR